MNETTAEQVRDWLLDAIEDETSETMGPRAWGTNGPKIVLKTAMGDWLITVEKLE